MDTSLVRRPVILSQTAVYALRACLRLAESESSGPVRVDDIASALDVPRNYLSKILHTLARGRVLVSTRGPGGGFELARPAKQTSLLEVVEPFGDLTGSSCLLGRSECTDEDPCPAHESWKDVSRSVRQFFTDRTLADLSRGAPLVEAAAET